MPMKIHIPKMDQYELVQTWIKETEEYFLGLLNDRGIEKPNITSFENLVLEHMRLNYPLSVGDLWNARVYLEFDIMRAEY